MPNTAIRDTGYLNDKSVLIRLIGGEKEEEHVAKFVKNKWKPRGTFRLTRVNRQSFKVTFRIFYDANDYNRIKTTKWDYLGNDLILIRPWTLNTNTSEDVLDTAPLKALIHNIPTAMWGEEVIGRISSSLDSSLEARSAIQRHPSLPPPLEASVVIEGGFAYLSNIRIRTEGNEGEPNLDTIVSVEYARRVPFCPRCEGFRHWPQQCHGPVNHQGGWNDYTTKG